MKKVFVGLSGGVDSGVSAALLKEQGFDVTGVFIKIWQPEFYECTWREDRLDAMRISAALDIPLREIDLSSEYKQLVVDPMLHDYSGGITPNPDVLCNRQIKFGAFAAWAKEQGADLIATGHYAQKGDIPILQNKMKYRDEGPRSHLLRARDTAKDQSYFLYTLAQDDLARILFPIGALQKSDVRILAKRFALPIADKPDSQGLCFVGEVSMREYLSRFIPVRPGPVVDAQGNEIGEHEGAMLYTIGQRHGFRATGAGPYFITKIDVPANTLHVSLRRNDAARSSVRVDAMHWIADAPTMPYEASVQARYHEAPVAALVRMQNDATHIEFREPHIAAAGQSLVVYDGDMCLGGGIIAA